MGDTAIEWTDKTWNPVVGCTKISPGCKNCYAKTLHDMRHEAFKNGKRVPLQYAEPFETVQLKPDRLADPLGWRKPQRVFVNSVSDLFHEDIPDEYIAAVFGVMAAAPQHTFQVLTKRAERMAQWLAWAEKRGHDGASIFPADDLAWRVRQMANVAARRAGVDMNPDGRQNHGGPWPLPNVWLGVSVEDQQRADERVPHLLRTPAAVRFLSVEPMLGPVDLTKWLPGEVPANFNERDGWVIGCHETEDELEMWREAVDWVIVGGESGHDARPFDLAWARDLRDQCEEAGCAFFCKQLGANAVAWRPSHEYPTDGSTQSLRFINDKKGGDPDEWPEDLRVRQFPEVPHV